MKLSLVRLFPASLLSTFVVIACSGANPQEVTTDPPPSNTKPTPFVDSSVAPDVSTLDAGTVPDPPAPPQCISEDNASFCGRNNKQCGSFTATDNCGLERNVFVCGACAAGTTCLNNTCVVPGCVPETDAQLCVRTASTCSYVNAVDNCGLLRALVACGMPCGKGSACVAGKCTACVPKVCAVGACGDIDDGCNPAPLHCPVCAGAMVCTNNVCAQPCVPFTNIALCDAVGQKCGSLDTQDNCGAPRSIPDCNGIPGQKRCDYVCMPDHSCCVPRASGQICSEAGGRVCGQLISAECGAAPSIINCGSCPIVTQTCNPVGKCVP